MSLLNEQRRGDRNRRARIAFSPPTAVGPDRTRNNRPNDRQAIIENQAAVRQEDQPAAGQRARRQAEGQQRRADATLSPLARRPVTGTFPLRHYLGPMDAICEACGAQHFEAEKSNTILASSPTPFRQCCHFGTVDLQPFPEPPLILKGLLSDQSPGDSPYKVDERC